jgi:hypothetical protein
VVVLLAADLVVLDGDRVVVQTDVAGRLVYSRAALALNSDTEPAV